MQQGLRPYVQDENALSSLHLRGGVGGGGLALKGGSENSLGGGGGLGGVRKGSTPGFPGARKALGNITNHSKGFGAENAPLPGKTPAAAPAPARRALGDITNSNAPAAQKQQQQKAPLTIKPAPSEVAAAAAVPCSRLDALAEGGVERLAGRGWEQLEQDRLAREDAEIQRRLTSLANFPGRALPTFFPFWGVPNNNFMPQLKKDVLPTPPASPMAKQLPGSAGNMAGGPLSVPDLSDLSLPDIAFDDMDLDL